MKTYIALVEVLVEAKGWADAEDFIDDALGRHPCVVDQRVKRVEQYASDTKVSWLIEKRPKPKGGGK